MVVGSSTISSGQTSQNREVGACSVLRACAPFTALGRHDCRSMKVNLAGYIQASDRGSRIGPSRHDM
jgi:hypothetical protein